MTARRLMRSVLGVDKRQNRVNGGHRSRENGESSDPGEDPKPTSATARSRHHGYARSRDGIAAMQESWA
jgi:hypothetical protein